MVELHSLKEDVEMNGRVGVCEWFDQQTRYFSVKLFPVGKSRYESTLLVQLFDPGQCLRLIEGLARTRARTGNARRANIRPASQAALEATLKCKYGIFSPTAESLPMQMVRSLAVLTNGSLPFIV